MRLLLMLLTALLLLGLNACSGVDLDDDQVIPPNVDPDNPFDIVPIGSYEGSAALNDPNARSIDFRVTENGIMIGEVKFIVNPAEVSQQIISRSFTGVIESQKVTIAEDNLSMYLIFTNASIGRFEASATTTEDTGTTMINANFIGNHIPDDDDSSTNPDSSPSANN